MTYKKNCKGCNITREQPTGGIIEIGEHWLVNQYWGDECWAMGRSLVI